MQYTVEISHAYLHTYILNTCRLNTYKEASVSTVDREDKLSAAASILEQDLTLGSFLIYFFVCMYVRLQDLKVVYVCGTVGITAIEDCLQDDVPKVIEDLATAG